MPRIDFEALADAALNQAESLLAAWLPKGQNAAGEWKSVNPMRGDKSAGSFSINITSGAWGDFATPDAGGDLISLCAYLFHNNDQLEAAYDVAGQIGFTMPPRPTARHERVQHKAERKNDLTASAQAAVTENKKKRKSPWVPILPVPSDATDPPLAHVVRGKPERTWCYRNAQGEVLGYIWRFVTSDGDKEVLPLTWCRHEELGKLDWRGVSFPDPRPLYGLDRLAAKPEATILIVEGEKCADVAHEQFPDLAVVTWPGGGKAVAKADWSVLTGRKVVIWPDCDAQQDKRTLAILPEEKQPGFKAAVSIAKILLSQDCKVWTVRIPAPGEKKSGWDIADAVDDGLAGEQLAAWVREHSVLYEESPPQDGADASAGGSREPPPDDDWVRRLLRTKQGDLRECVMNVHDILLHMPSWDGVIAFDDFAQCTVKRKPPPYINGVAGQWDDDDDTQTAMWLSRHWRFAPDPGVVGKAIEALAKEHRFNPVKDYLHGLPKWDSTSRVEHWLVDFAGVTDSEYVRKVSRFFLIGMVARAMRPGCKFDYCLVLEGEQGKKKSMVASVLGGQWYGDTDLNLENKDSMQSLSGKWVYEFAEMGAVTRTESAKQKSFLSRQIDEFRPVYGKRMVRLKRQVVFVGTTNEDEWNKDPTGGRRFWSVKCLGDIDPEGLVQVREQLFAEAFMLFEKGERHWPTPEEQRTLFSPEQAQREQQEGLIDALHDWVYGLTSEFSIAEAAMTGLKLDASKLTRDLQTRIGTALRKLGCTKVERRNGMIRYWYKPPVRNEATSKPVSPSAPSKGDKHAPF